MSLCLKPYVDVPVDEQKQDCGWNKPYQGCEAKDDIHSHVCLVRETDAE